MSVTISQRLNIYPIDDVDKLTSRRFLFVYAQESWQAQAKQFL